MMEYCIVFQVLIYVQQIAQRAILFQHFFGLSRVSRLQTGGNIICICVPANLGQVAEDHLFDA